MQCRPHTVGGRLLFTQLLNFKKMFYQIFLAIFLALACPSHKTNKQTATTRSGATTMAQDTTTLSGGDNGHIHP
jgi:uncharacterized protein YpmB